MVSQIFKEILLIFQILLEKFLLRALLKKFIGAEMNHGV